MNDKCCEITCGADACSICGACRTEHNEDPVDNCPKHPIHRTTANCQRIKELKAENKSARAKYDLYKVYAEDIVKSQAGRIKKLIEGQQAKTIAGS